MSESLIKQEFLTELELILESDEAYGSNIQVLTYSVKDETINGKFKDSWNNRVYGFVIDVDGISYKPAAKLDSFSEDELPARFDSFSEGYASLFSDTRLDKGLTGKRVKKPKCGGTAYGCGFGCIGLQKTCRILSSGKKAGTNQGKAIGKERLTKLLTLAKKVLGAGEGAKFRSLTATATSIAGARNKQAEKGIERLSQRKANKQLEFIAGEKKVVSKTLENPQSELKSKAKTLAVDQEIFKTKFPPKEIQREYGLGGVVDRAKTVVDFINNPKEFTQLSSSDQAGYLDNIVTIHGVSAKNWDEELEKPAVANDPSRKLGAEATNIRAQGAKQIWDNLNSTDKSKLAQSLKESQSRLANEDDEFENKYVAQLADEVRKLIK